MATVALTKESQLSSETPQLAQISCVPDQRPLVLFYPSINPELGPDFRDLLVWKGPFPSPTACYTFHIGQQLMKLVGMPWLRTSVHYLECDPERMKLAPYGLRRGLKEGWFVGMESVYTKAGYPRDTPLPDRFYKSKSKRPRTDGKLPGQEWEEIKTRVVRHDEMAEYDCFFPRIYDPLISLDVVKAVLMRYILGWPDAEAERNYIQIKSSGETYLLDGDRFKAETMNPFGRYLKYARASSNISARVKANVPVLIDWIEKLLGDFRTDEARDICNSVPLWPTNDYNSAAVFLDSVVLRLFYILEGLRSAETSTKITFLTGLAYFSTSQQPKAVKKTEQASFVQDFDEFCSDEPDATLGKSRLVAARALLAGGDEESKGIEIQTSGESADDDSDVDELNQHLVEPLNETELAQLDRRTLRYVGSRLREDDELKQTPLLGEVTTMREQLARSATQISAIIAPPPSSLVRKRPLPSDDAEQSPSKRQKL